METGDVIFFRKQNTFISRAIARVTKSDFTHVGLVLDEKTIIESDRVINTRIVEFEPKENLHVVYRSEHMSDTIKEKIIPTAIRFEQYPYDYFQIFVMFIRLVFRMDLSFLNRKTHLICSEIIDYTFLTSGLPRKNNRNIGDVVVGDLIELYEMKEVPTWQEKLQNKN